jgi:hypothetical protein
MTCFTNEKSVVLRPDNFICVKAKYTNVIQEHLTSINLSLNCFYLKYELYTCPMEMNRFSMKQHMESMERNSPSLNKFCQKLQQNMLRKLS